MIAEVTRDSAPIADLAVLSLAPVLGTIALGLATSLAVRDRLPAGIADNTVIWVSMGLAMVVLPYWFLKRRQPELRLSDVGLVRPAAFSLVAVAAVIGAIVAVKVGQGRDLGLILGQNLPIALAEEFWCRGVLTRQARTFLRSDTHVLLVTALVFAFVTHLSGSPLDNLLYRFPFGLLVGFIYLKTRSLTWPVTLHLAYNMLIS